MSEQPAELVPVRRKRVLFLFSDTGGGHRSATEAIIEAMEAEFPGKFEPHMVDFFREYYPRPLRFAPELYPPISRVPQAWRFTFKAFDSKGRARAVTQLSYPYIRRGAHRLLRENPADLIVSVHPLVNAHVMRAMRHHPRPYLTVVTDLVSTHALWFDRRADLVVVATPEARDKAIRYGIPKGNLRQLGLPVAARFTDPAGDTAAWRDKMGWRQDLPVILLVGGGDGMGPLKRVAKAINEAKLKATLVVICGRNSELQHELSQLDWQLPVHLYGFTTEMPQFMAAADVLVTKAGPGTISEAFIAGLPLVLYAKLPGQEDGNVSYVEKLKAGVWAPRPREVVEVLRKWVDDPEARELAAAASRAASNPQAARQIARLIADQMGESGDPTRP